MQIEPADHFAQIVWRVDGSREGGAVYDICVTAVISLPGVPTVITGSHNTVTGIYTVHIGDLREGG